MAHTDKDTREGGRVVYTVPMDSEHRCRCYYRYVEDI